MAYKISGTLNDTARIIVLREDTWAIESSNSRSTGPFAITCLVSGTKTVLSITNEGKVIGFGGINSFFGPGERGLILGGRSANDSASAVNNIDYITIDTASNSLDFGDLSAAKYYVSSLSNGANDRGVSGGGILTNSSYINVIEYVTISILGNTADFGDLLTTQRYMSTTSNNTNNRGIFAGGTGNTNVIQYITISNIGNSAAFGELTIGRVTPTSTSNGTNNRGVTAGGQSGSPINTIDYITISSAGNASDFGDLSDNNNSLGSTSNLTNDRGIMLGGYNGSVGLNTIEYITVSTTGNTTDFGDLSSTSSSPAATSNGINNRGVLMGFWIGYAVNSIDYFTISSTGNSQTFGELLVNRASHNGGISNA